MPGQGRSLADFQSIFFWSWLFICITLLTPPASVCLIHANTKYIVVTSLLTQADFLYARGSKKQCLIILSWK